MQVKIRKLQPEAITPTYATDGSGCFDIYACMSFSHLTARGEGANPHDRVVQVPTGLSFEIPVGHELQVFSRSGHGFNHMVKLVNSTGIIDSDYRGELFVGLQNDGWHDFKVCHGDRIAQGHVVPVEHVEFIEVADELSATERGTGGFGSTGA